MKKIILILMLALSLIAKGQIYQPIPGYGFSWNRGSFVQSLFIPEFSSPTLNSNIDYRAAIGFKTGDTTHIWLYNPATQTWNAVGSGGTSSDTTLQQIFDTEHGRAVMNKDDTIYRAGHVFAINYGSATVYVRNGLNANPLSSFINNQGALNVDAQDLSEIGLNIKMWDYGFTRGIITNFYDSTTLAGLGDPGHGYQSAAATFQTAFVNSTNQVSLFMISGAKRNVYADSANGFLSQGAGMVFKHLQNNGYFTFGGNGGEYGRFAAVTGNLGLRTTAPDSTLTVVGGLRFATGRQANGYVLTSNATGGADWQPSAASPQKFGKDDVLAGEDRSFDANGHEFTITNALEIQIAVSGAGPLNLAGNGDNIYLYPDSIRIIPPSTGRMSIEFLQSMNNADDSMMVWSPSSKRWGMKPIPSGSGAQKFGKDDVAAAENRTFDATGFTFQINNATSMSLGTMAGSLSISSTTNLSYSGTNFQVFSGGFSMGGDVNISNGFQLALGVKTTSGDPTAIANGAMYYNSNSGKFRVRENSTWKDMISAASTNWATADQTLTANRSHSTGGFSLTVNNTLNGSEFFSNTIKEIFISDGSFLKSTDVQITKDNFNAQTANQGTTRYSYLKTDVFFNEISAVTPGGTSVMHMDSTMIDITTATFRLPQTALKLKGASANTLTVKVNETLSALRTLNIITGDADRTLTFTGNASITGTNTGDQTTVTGNAGTATALQNVRTIWGQNFDGTGNVTGSLTAVADITGGASSMTVTAGTGNSRTLTFKTTTSGGTATTALTLAADQSATFANTVNATTFVGAFTGNASTATALQTTRAIYGNNFDGSAALTQIIASTFGGTGNGFTKFSGPATSEKMFTLPNASATILTDNALVTAAQGGTANGFFAVSGPASSTKTFTFPNASAAVLTDNALVTAAQGGTANGFFQVSGPATSTKTFTFPNASATVLTDNAAVTGAQGGTGVSNSGKTITVSGNTSIGSSTNTVAFTTSGNTSIAIPTTGTMAILGANTFTGAQDFGGNTITGYAATVNAQTGTTYTLVSSDNGKVITFNNAGAITLTVPSGLGNGFNCTVVQIGAGQVTFTASSTTISNRSSFTKTAGNKAMATLVAYAADTFVTGGDMQ